MNLLGFFDRFVAICDDAGASLFHYFILLIIILAAAVYVDQLCMLFLSALDVFCLYS